MSLRRSPRLRKTSQEFSTGQNNGNFQKEGNWRTNGVRIYTGCMGAEYMCKDDDSHHCPKHESDHKAGP